MTRASTQQSRTTTYASFSNLTSPTLNNNLMLSDDDGGPDEGMYGARVSLDGGNESIIWSGWDEVWWDGQNTPR
jgi:hypothetical protein